MFVMHPNLVVVFTVIKVEGGKEGGGGGSHHEFTNNNFAFHKS